MRYWLLLERAGKEHKLTRFNDVPYRGEPLNIRDQGIVEACQTLAKATGHDIVEIEINAKDSLYLR